MTITHIVTATLVRYSFSSHPAWQFISVWINSVSLQSPGNCDIFIHAPGATQENEEWHVHEDSSRNPQELVRMFCRRLPAPQGTESHSMHVSCYKTACKQGCRNAHMEVPNPKAMFQPWVWAPEKQKGKLMPFPLRNSCLWKSELPHYRSRRKDVLAGVQIIRAL